MAGHWPPATWIAVLGVNNEMGEIDETSAGGLGTTNLLDLTNPGLLMAKAERGRGEVLFFEQRVFP